MRNLPSCRGLLEPALDGWIVTHTPRALRDRLHGPDSTTQARVARPAPETADHPALDRAIRRYVAGCVRAAGLRERPGTASRRRSPEGAGRAAAACRALADDHVGNASGARRGPAADRGRGAATSLAAGREVGRADCANATPACAGSSLKPRATAASGGSCCALKGRLRGICRRRRVDGRQRCGDGSLLTRPARAERAGAAPAPAAAAPTPAPAPAAAAPAPAPAPVTTRSS